MFDADAAFGLFTLVVVSCITILVGFRCKESGKFSVYLDTCQKSCPTQTAQVIESPTERVRMCGTKLEGTLVLEVRKP